MVRVFEIIVCGRANVAREKENVNLKCTGKMKLKLKFDLCTSLFNSAEWDTCKVLSGAQSAFTATCNCNSYFL